MKNIDVSQNVMEKIVRFEQSRTRRWLRIFFTTLAVLFILFGILSWVNVQTLNEFRAWDMLHLFREDPEIIGDYWQDTVSVFLSFLPPEMILLSLLVIVGVVLFIVGTGKRRKIVITRARELEKKKRLDNNTGV